MLPSNKNKLFLSHSRRQIVIIHVKIIELLLGRHFLSKNVILAHSVSAINLLGHSTHRKNIWLRLSIHRNGWTYRSFIFEDDFEKDLRKIEKSEIANLKRQKWGEIKSKTI